MLDDLKLHVKTRLSALWVSVTLCYLYGDVIGNYNPGQLQMMMDGKMGTWEITRGLLLGIAIVMSIPAIMVILTLILKSTASRLLNIIMGILFTLIMLDTMFGAWLYNNYYYIYLGLVEVVLTSLVVWYAITWPKQISTDED